MPLTQVQSGMMDSIAQYNSFKNRIINGAMVISQRGTSFTNSTGNIYTLDRWLSTTVSSSCTVQQITGSTGNNKAIQVTGAAGNATTQLSQRIEAANIYDCASQTVTVSFTLSGSASASASVRFLYPTATDNFTTQTEPVAGTTVNFTTTPTRYSVTRVLDANANKGLNLLFERGATGAGVTWTLEDVQLEKGSTATAFDYRPYGTELNLCQRYCRVFAGSTTLCTALSFGTTTTSGSLMFGQTMRATPTLTPSSVTGFQTTNGGGAGITSTNFGAFLSTPDSTEIQITVASGLTVGQAAVNRTGTGTLTISAEL
jgi:hypothetical protein